MVRLPVYPRRVQAGVVKARPEFESSTPGPHRRSSTATTGSGRWSARARWTPRCDLAREHGTGFVGVRHSNHFGPAAYYVERAIERGCIGLAISNAPPNMAPFGGKTRFLGTNPVAIGVPAGDEPPLIFDASTSVVARGKIIVAAHATGSGSPKGGPSIRTATRRPMPTRRWPGAVLPFGGPKGSAIAFIIDIVCGVLTGAAFASHLNTLENLGGRAERRARVRGDPDRLVRS